MIALSYFSHDPRSGVHSTVSRIALNELLIKRARVLMFLDFLGILLHASNQPREGAWAIPGLKSSQKIDSAYICIHLFTKALTSNDSHDGLFLL
jgi:hypothetical protein